MDKKEQAIKCFNNGFNCCQAVLSVFHQEVGMDRDSVFKIVTDFGGGMRKGEVCGAVTGSIMVLGLK